MPLPILLLGAAVGVSLAVVVSETVPRLNVEASCRAAAKVNRQIDLADNESTKNCMRDEQEARAELVQKWSSFSASDRGRCVGETMADGESPSYVDLLTCLQLCRGRKRAAAWSEQKTEEGLVAKHGVGNLRWWV